MFIAELFSAFVPEALLIISGVFLLLLRSCCIWRQKGKEKKGMSSVYDSGAVFSFVSVACVDENKCCNISVKAYTFKQNVFRKKRGL